MCQAEVSESTEPYLFFRQQSWREGFGCAKQKEVLVQYTQCVPLPNLIGKANGQASSTVSATAKKVCSLPPIVTGNAGGKVRVLTRLPT